MAKYFSMLLFIVVVAFASTALANEIVTIDKTVSIRKEPSIYSDTAWKTKTGDKLELLDEQENWVRVKSQNGKIGWIYAALIKPEKTMPLDNDTSTSQNTTNYSSNVDYNTVQRVASAKEVMALANQDCRIYEEGPHLVVEMRMYITDPNQRLGYVRAIADSDVVLHGQPRNIYFYDPSNKQIAQADTLSGVRLID